MIIAAVASALLHLPMPSVLEMHAQLNAIEAGKAPSVFRHVLAWDFYDGIETGLAVSTDRLHYRIRSLGDSRSIMFRAFALTHLPNFDPDTLPPMCDSADASRFAFIETDVWKYAQATATGDNFIAIGNSYLDHCVCKQLTEAIPETFAAAHGYLTDKFRPWRRRPQPD